MSIDDKLEEIIDKQAYAEFDEKERKFKLDGWFGIDQLRALIALVTNDPDCPVCGGSGHIEDARSFLGQFRHPVLTWKAALDECKADPQFTNHPDCDVLLQKAERLLTLIDGDGKQ